VCVCDNAIKSIRAKWVKWWAKSLVCQSSSSKKFRRKRSIRKLEEGISIAPFLLSFEKVITKSIFGGPSQCRCLLSAISHDFRIDVNGEWRISQSPALNMSLGKCFLLLKMYIHGSLCSSGQFIKFFTVIYNFFR